eukprot:196324-Prymnesium_polylepis.1
MVWLPSIARGTIVFIRVLSCSSRFVIMNRARNDAPSGVCSSAHSVFVWLQGCTSGFCSGPVAGGTASSLPSPCERLSIESRWSLLTARPPVPRHQYASWFVLVILFPLAQPAAVSNARATLYSTAVSRDVCCG